MTAVGSTSLKRELARLRDLERAQLQQLWRGLYGSDPPEQISRQLLLLGVAHRLQVIGRDYSKMEISVIGPADLDTIKRLQDEGVSRVTIGPPAFEPNALRGGLEKINRDIIAKV